MQVNNITVSELHARLEKNNEIIILDVRERDEYIFESIQNSLNVPLSNLLFETEKIKVPTNATIVLTCKAGVRSVQAYKILTECGYTFDMYNLEGGLTAWKNAGYIVN